jgi:putative addiction module component (TIGR02574 family)
VRPNEIIKEIDNLGLSEKLPLVESVWDSTARDNGVLPMLAWQKPELDKRYKDYKNGDVTLRNLGGCS